MKLRSNEMNPQEYFTLLFLKRNADVQQKNEGNSEFVEISVFIGSKIKTGSGSSGVERGRVVRVGGSLFSLSSSLSGEARRHVLLVLQYNKIRCLC